MNDLDTLIANVLEWGRIRGLHATDDLKPQLTKLIEELGEVAAGVARDDDVRILDGIGDLLVVMINLGAVWNIRYGTPEAALAPEAHDFMRKALDHAWNQIANRTGKTVDGVFVKDTAAAMYP
jgi:NTP pyrophosphatase (non-canonical NTP hydrolase)